MAKNEKRPIGFENVLQPEHGLEITEAKTSKLTVDDGVGSFKVSFNVKGLKQGGQSLDDIVQVLNRLADIRIVPYQTKAKFRDPDQEEMTLEERELADAEN